VAVCLSAVLVLLAVLPVGVPVAVWEPVVDVDEEEVMVVQTLFAQRTDCLPESESESESESLSLSLSPCCPPRLVGLLKFTGGEKENSKERLNVTYGCINPPFAP